MGVWWNSFGTLFSCFLVLALVSETREAWSLNDEGLALLQFRAGVDYDPHDALASWNPHDADPCSWEGVYCKDGKVEILNLSSLSLEGTLAPELGRLAHLRSLFLFDDKLEDHIPLEINRVNSLSELQFEENIVSAACYGIGCVNKKSGDGVLGAIPIKGVIVRLLNSLSWPMFKYGNLSRHDCTGSFGQRRILQQLPNIRALPEPSSTNLPALPPPLAPAPLFPDPVIVLPASRSSGGFPAVASAKKTPTAPSPPHSATNPPKTVTPFPVQHSNHKPDATSGANVWERFGKYIVIFLAVNLLFVVVAIMFILIRRRGIAAIRPWKTGLSGQLQKAFITGVPKLNRAELDIACEDFSNIIENLDACTIYKGTLSSGVEIAVASSGVKSFKDWSSSLEKAFRKKIDTLSRVNHKNFVNLIGYCEENDPFTRMMVFEYAPNGTLFEHLHVQGVDHLDWSARMRIVMGIAYYLQYTHHDLNPPVAHSDLNSKNVLLSEDYAAKIVDIVFAPQCKCKTKAASGEEEGSSPEQPPAPDAKSNVYSFGILLLETISGKLPYSDEHGSLVDWASQYLSDKNNIEKIVDPTLKSFEQDELNTIMEAIRSCINPDLSQRPTMKQIVSRFREALAITPEQAVPRLSPLWWAELEILSVEAA